MRHWHFNFKKRRRKGDLTRYPDWLPTFHPPALVSLVLGLHEYASVSCLAFVPLHYQLSNVVCDLGYVSSKDVLKWRLCLMN